MITRIELHNFMSHALTVIEPAAGLTVLVGPNNVGKSAIVAALKILCRNENSTYVMRHGERECAILLDTDDGHHVEWRRRTSPSYLIDGRKFDRLRQGGLPDELHQALRLPTVDSGEEDDFDVHFGTQKTPIFLLNSSPAVAARFFASSSDAIRLVEIQRRHKDKFAEKQKEKNRLEAESKQLHAELETLEPIAELDVRLRAAEHDHDQLTQQAAWLKEAAQTAADLAKLTELRTQHQARAATLAKLPSPPTLPSPEPLTKLIDGIAAMQRAAAAARRQVAVLQEIPAPPPPEPTADLTTLLTELAKGLQDRRRATALAAALVQVPEPPPLEDPAPLDQLVQRLARGAQVVQRGTEEVRRLAPLANPPLLEDAALLRQLIERRVAADRGLAQTVRRHETLRPLAPPPPPDDAQGLQQLLARVDAAAQKAGDEAREVRRLTEELSAAEQELRTVAAQSTCRLCGSPLDPERVLARAAGGLSGGGHDHA